MQKIYQIVEHIQGNRMMDPGITRYREMFSSRYLANKYRKKHYSHINYTTVETRTVFESMEEAEKWLR